MQLPALDHQDERKDNLSSNNGYQAGMSDTSRTLILPLPRSKIERKERAADDMNDSNITTPISAKRKATTSLLLTRWLGSKSPSSQDIESGDNWSLERSMDYGTPPPVEEPHCYSMCISESSCTEETNYSLQVNKDIIRNLLIEHTRQIGSKIQILEDLELGRIDIDNKEKIVNSYKQEEIDTLLLHACFLGRVDYIIGLEKCGANVNTSEQEQNLTPLHLCAFSNSLIGLEYLIGHGANINCGKGHTPFHYAAFGNSYEVARYFLQKDITEESLHSEETVLHVAARSNALEVLKLLAPNNISLNRLDVNGFAPIHYVADKGDPACLKILLQAACQVDLSSKKGDTALHIAAEAGCLENVDLLLENGANVNLKNNRGQTALHLAARSHCLDCVELLLRKGHSDPNDEDIDGRTPLHLALGRSLLAYDVTETLIIWRANVNKVDKYGYTPLHVAALNELSQCVDILIQHNGDLSARTKGGTSALSIILRKTPTSLDVFKQRLDASITLHQHRSAAGEIELRLDFHPLLQHQQKGEIGYLGTFVKEGYKEILEHPLCQSFLHLKWQKIKKYYIGRLLFYLLYVLVLTAWVITALAHNCYNESHGQVDDPSTTLCANTTGLNGFLYRHPVVLEVEWYALVVLTVLEALRKLTGILTYLSVKQFFTQAENMVEWCVILSVFATSFVYTGRTYTWQSHVGAFAVLCGWSNLMLMIGQLPMFGAYVAMFTSVQAQVFKLLLAYACLLVGFTASFCVIFPRSKSFSSPHTGLIKVLVMMTGELDFEDLFFPGEEEGGKSVDVSGTSWILLQVSAQLSFVLFLLFVTIVLMNLLVGIAVHDIKGLQKTAGLAKLVRQTKLICDVERALFLGLLPNKLTKLLWWTAVVLPSPLRAILTVRPLNPRETRLPRDVLTAAHKVAKDRKFASGTLTSKKSNSTYYTYVKSDGYSTIRNRFNGNDNLSEDNGNKFKDELLEVRKICEKNHQLIQDLVIALAMDKKYNKEQQEDENH
ncbi:transient receptor potential channel pyrexia-like isoform X1 [Vespa mandarinia]|uniref:transient receptor potential channel pyrexia-like isoform X1 n=2 Tax=Vespa mandarinia TaxID=7446 RepID=UPI00160D5973|nr:transient receptor potential channel pyrexia-like isoform X1 [Vespa mandarinia]XP_035720384.1 transient receptor potential channel pyrexia-like isoform X1 [Vespa mandarinia]